MILKQRAEPECMPGADALLSSQSSSVPPPAEELTDKVTAMQFQLGVTCVALVRCLDCGRGGEVRIRSLTRRLG